MSMEQFLKCWKATDTEDLYLKDEITFDDIENVVENIWKECCQWFLELNRDHTPGTVKRLVNQELGLSNEFTATADGPLVGDVTRLNLLRDDELEADISTNNVKVTEMRDGMRDVCIEKCGWLQRKACMGTDGMQNKIAKEMGCCPDLVEKNKPEKPVVNEATDCKHYDTCRRGCKILITFSSGYCWLGSMYEI